MEEERDELMSTSSGYMDSNYPYQHHHRHRRSSFDNGTGAPIIVAGGGVPSMSYGTPLTSTMPLPGVAGTMVGGGSPYGGIYGGTQGMYPGAVGSISGTYPGIYNTNPAPYGSVPGAYGQPVYTAPYTSGGLLANPYGVTNAGGYALSYDGTPVVGGAYTSPYGGNVYAGQSAAPSVIIQPGRRHHHRHHSH